MQTITTLYALSNMDSEKIVHVRPNCLKLLMILPYLINTGEHTDFILLDFSKAFDKVSHNSLLYKLAYYGINGLGAL